MSKKVMRDEPTLRFLSSLKELRFKKGLTLETISKKLDIPLKTYMNYEYSVTMPLLSNLFVLAEFFDYDLSGSINHKRYYGGLPQIETVPQKRDKKCIYLDEPAKRFLNSLRSEREKIGLTLIEAAGLLGCNFGQLADYEKLEYYPMLGMFIKLAELYKYDVSDSVNYKYFYQKINKHDFRTSLKRYGLGRKELAQLTGYSEGAVNKTVNFTPGLSLGCLSAILKVIEQENTAYKHRQRLLNKSRSEEYNRNRRYSNA